MASFITEISDDLGGCDGQRSPVCQACKEHTSTEAEASKNRGASDAEQPYTLIFTP